MDVQIRHLAAEQYDVVAAWQLMALGATRRMVDGWVRRRGWRMVHPGVYALTNAPLTRHQRWMSATLTAPETALSHASAAACWGFRRFDGSFETVIRPGSGGPRRTGGVLVSRSTGLADDVARHQGIPITTPERTLIDLAPHLTEPALGRALREALRLKSTTARRILLVLARHRGRRGTAALERLATRYAALPYERTRSDAEGRALEVLHDAGVATPRVNHRVAGEEADIVWPGERRIIEIDGPQFHRFPEEDARKQRRWERAGYEVRRIGTDAVYDTPAKLVALAPGGCAPGPGAGALRSVPVGSAGRDHAR